VVFGTLEWETSQGKSRLDFPNVQGGCLGFMLESARMIADSGLLLSERLADYRETYADNQDIIIRAEKMGLISADFIIRYACRQLDHCIISFFRVYFWRISVIILVLRVIPAPLWIFTNSLGWANVPSSALVVFGIANSGYFW